MKIIESIVTNGHGTLNASYLVIHETANPGASALNHVNYWRNNPAYAVHYVGDWTGDVYHCVPDDRLCWQVGNANDKVIGIELCHGRNSVEFQKVWDVGVDFAVWFLRRKGWGVDRMLSHDYCRRKWGGTDHTDPIGYFKKYGRSWEQFVADVDKKLNAPTYIPGTGETKPTTGLQATSLINLSDAEIVNKVGSLFTEDQKKTGVLASISMAQFILESAYGKSELAQKANNCFGMKKSLSGNTWPGSTWDGKSVYVKQTKEQNANGTYVTITAEFRKYPNIESSIADHSAYLLGAKKGTELRYKGLKGCTDYRKAAQIIKDGGYATSHTYVANLCAVVEKWDLTRFDYKGGSTTPSTPSVTPSTPSTKPSTGKKTPNITYAIRTVRSGILPDVKNGAVAGRTSEVAIGVKIGVDVGTVKYRVHCGGRWLPAVTGNNWNDYDNGWAGDGRNAIDAIQIYYTSDRSKTDVYEAEYAVKPIGFKSYLANVYDTNWANSDGDHTAGIFGKPFGELRIKLVKC